MDLQYNYSAIQDACQQMMSATGQISNDVESLVNQVKQNQEAYLQGAASDAYGVASNDIAQQLDQCTTNLQTMSNNTLTGSQDVQSTDNRLAGQF
jgi:WXG100 family type VII secretion target